MVSVNLTLSGKRATLKTTITLEKDALRDANTKAENLRDFAKRVSVEIHEWM